MLSFPPIGTSVLGLVRSSLRRIATCPSTIRHAISVLEIPEPEERRQKPMSTHTYSKMTFLPSCLLRFLSPQLIPIISSRRSLSEADAMFWSFIRGMTWRYHNCLSQMLNALSKNGSRSTWNEVSRKASSTYKFLRCVPHFRSAESRLEKLVRIREQ